MRHHAGLFVQTWAHACRFRNWLALVLLGLFLIPQTNVRGAADSPLASLYDALLVGTNSAGCVTFERYIEAPTLGRLGSTNASKLPSPETGYVTFLWDTSQYLVAYSRRAPIEEAAVSSAERLYGFDGTNYWQLLDIVSRTHVNDGGQTPVLASAAVRRYLTVIPAKEVSATADKHAAKFNFTTIDEWAAECRRVAQLGFSFPLEQAPKWINSNSFSLAAKGRGTQVVQVTGKAEKPEVLTYAESTNGLPRYRVATLFDENRLVIDRSVVTIRYRVLSARVSNVPAPGTAYSWQAYKHEGER